MAVSWPAGIRSAGIACGIKKSRREDLGVIVADRPLVWAGVFTQNAAAAAPVIWCRDRLLGDVRAIVVNSGNANACTGDAGTKAVRLTAEAAAAAIGAAPEEVLVASTGPIGVPLPVDKVVAALPEVVSGLSTSTETFARSILTTDTRIKLASWAGDVTVVGVAKGAAMLAPNMATMLAFIATDADLTRDELQKALRDSVGRSFDRISVDACESTNDSVICLATGEKRATPGDVTEGLTAVCASLAHQIVSDAEGATKLVRIRIDGARDEVAAVGLGRAVAASDLWRAAVHGGDPNWGRVLSALGAADREIELNRVELKLGDAVVFRRGEPTFEDAAAATAAMSGDEVLVSCSVGHGPGAAEILTADLSPEYVRLNAEGTS